MTGAGLIFSCGAVLLSLRFIAPVGRADPPEKSGSPKRDFSSPRAGCLCFVVQDPFFSRLSRAGVFIFFVPLLLAPQRIRGFGPRSASQPATTATTGMARLRKKLYIKGLSAA